MEKSPNRFAGETEMKGPNQTQETNWRRTDALHACSRFAGAIHAVACLFSTSRSVLC